MLMGLPWRFWKTNPSVGPPQTLRHASSASLHFDTSGTDDAASSVFGSVTLPRHALLLMCTESGPMSSHRSPAISPGLSASYHPSENIASDLGSSFSFSSKLFA